MRLFFRFVFMVLAVLAADYLVSGIHVDTITTALIAGAALTVIQIIIKPIVKILTIPITIITLGFFLLVLNAMFFWFVSGLVPGMGVDSFMAAFLGSLVVSALNWLFDHTFKRD